MAKVEVEVAGPCPKCGRPLNSKDEMIRHFTMFHKEQSNPERRGERV